MNEPDPESANTAAAPSERPALDLAAIRERLAGMKGRVLWQSLEELAGDPEFDEGLRREFPRLASEWPEGTSRRRFLELGGASFALAGLVACTRQPTERIVPYVRQPEELVPGQPLFFASAITIGGVAEPVLVESHMGRPTKIEGNPEHPASLGATTAQAQASVLSLYDPDRLQAVSHLGRVRSWAEASAALSAALSGLPEGNGFRILTGNVTSPTFAAGIRTLRAKFPKLGWHRWEPAFSDNGRMATKWALGSAADLRFDLAEADVVATFDHDLLAEGAASVRASREFAKRRRDPKGPGRLYAVESTPTGTGAVADHRFVADSSDVERMLYELARILRAIPLADVPERHPQASGAPKYLEVLAKDLSSREGRALVTAGPSLSAAAHLAAIAINGRLGAAGRTVFTIPPLDQGLADDPSGRMGGAESIATLVRDMNAGKVAALLVVGGNPVFDAPTDLDFGGALEKVPLRFRLSLEDDETAERCHWLLPMAHDLEAFGDALAADGTTTMQQPLIEPLYGGRSAIEVLEMLAGGIVPKGEELVRATHALSPFEFRKALHDGFVPAAAPEPTKLVASWDAVSGASGEIPLGVGNPGFELSFRPDPGVHDGRFANNGWLQELPRPSTKLTWDNAALLSPSAAKQLGVTKSGDVVAITALGRTVEIPAVILPGQAPRTITLHFGEGRRRGGRVAAGAGTDVYPLRTSGSLWRVDGVEVRATGRSVPLAITQGHFRMEGRELAREVSAAELAEHPERIRKEFDERPSHEIALYPQWKYEGYKWGMAIDLSVCTGCSACVVACQSENNIAVVGKEQVLRGREMQWIRIDRYYEGDPETPRMHDQPVPCMQCENAPCEVVCPVAATSHSDEGLNDMTYNRCVGTRYCSNNCPYKVRRFNFLQYQDKSTPVLDLLRNPDVSVRERGVMEKCTYCVQRINASRIVAEREDRKIVDGEIVPACAQACGSRAISFGDLNDPKAAVVRAKADPRNYGLLEELATRPRTTYLAKIRNPNPELGG